MWRRGPFWAAAVAASLGLCSCSTSRGHNPAAASAGAQASPGAATPASASSPSPPEQLQRELATTQLRIGQLEQQLGAQERELEQARQETGDLRERELAARSQLQELQAHVEQNRAPYVAMAATSGGAWDAYQERTAQEGGSSLVATLRQKLHEEREQRVHLEREIERLEAEQAESASGPFENKLQSDLAEARKQVEDLKNALRTEREARQDLAHRFEQLQVELERVRKERPAETGGASEEIAALQERQRRVLASIERDLLLSRQRENELRSALEASQGPDAVPLAAAVSDLRAQNDALQTRLEDEHHRNRELSAKLNLAARVTDLIFKMRNAGPASTLPTH
jgi:chromosome segregation ATPase